MRIAALDYGQKRIGIALSDPMGILSSRSWVEQRRGDGPADAARVAAVLREAEVELVVVGMPLHFDNTEGTLAGEVRAFAASLEKELGVAVDFWDERMTTMIAEQVLLSADMSRQKRKKVIDGMSAALILQSYLDRRRLHKKDTDDSRTV